MKEKHIILYQGMIIIFLLSADRTALRCSDTALVKSIFHSNRTYFYTVFVRKTNTNIDYRQRSLDKQLIEWTDFKFL